MGVEEKLLKYNGYERGLLDAWKAQLRGWEQCVEKVLEYIWILDSRKIRSLLRDLVGQNIRLFEANNSFVCKFGPVGKSGEILAYEFRHTFKRYNRKLIESWEIPTLAEGSKVVFLDDLVGTGIQSSNYICEKLTPVLNPSHEAYLLCLCATPQGITKVQESTNVVIIPGIILQEEKYQYFSAKCPSFEPREKEFLRELNARLHDPSLGYYDYLGLLLAFYFTVPNNTLPFIWKDKAVYKNGHGAERKWKALLPRDY